MITVRSDWCETRLGTLPSRNSLRPLMPTFPTTTTSTSSLAAVLTIACAGSSPVAITARASSPTKPRPYSSSSSFACGGAVEGGTTTWHRSSSASKRVAMSAAKRTATSAVSERSVATRIRRTPAPSLLRPRSASFRPIGRASLPALELGRPLLQESRKTLLRVLGRCGEVEQAALVVHPERQRPLLGPGDGLLGQLVRHRALGRDVARDPLRLVEPRLSRDHAGDEPRLQRLAGGQAAAGEDHVHRQRLADGARQPLCAAGARDEAKAGLRLAEDGRLRAHDQVA